MKIKFKNANILSKTYDILENYDLIINDNIIEKIRVSSDEDDDNVDRIIECNSNYLIPGFKNAHTHNAMTFARSLTDDLPLELWLRDKIFPYERKLTEEDVYYFTILGIIENLSSGITSCMDMYMYYPTLAEAYYNTGFRVCLLDSITKFDKVICPEEYYIKFNNYKDDNGNRIKYAFGLHSQYTNDENIFKLMSEVIHKYKKPFFSHSSETKAEVKNCIEKYGMTPTELFDSYGLYDYGGGGHHCVYLSDKDIEIYKKHNLYVVANAASNLKLASGIAPYKKYYEAGIKIAVGTDGPGSNNSINIFKEIFLISTLSKVVTMDAESILAKEIIKMPILNSAAVMDESDVDSIDIGKKADLVLIDVNTPNMQPKNNFINNLVYAGSTSNVKLTMVDGKVLYEDGKFFINEDVEYIYNKCNKLLKNLKERI